MWIEVDGKWGGGGQTNEPVSTDRGGVTGERSGPFPTVAAFPSILGGRRERWRDVGRAE